MKALRRQTLRSPGESLSLIDWAKVDWFFPKEFSLQGTEETETSFHVYGEVNGKSRKTYKFLKPLLAPSEINETVFSERLELLLQEYSLGKKWAEGFYQGIAFIEWIDGEPGWLGETDWNGLEEFLEKVEDFSNCEPVLVTSKLPKRASLANSLRLRSVKSPKRIKDLAEIIAANHQATRTEASEQNHYYHSLRRGVNEFLWPVYNSQAAYIDPFSQLLFAEALGFITSELRDLEKDLAERQKRGLSVSVHGKLRAESIYFPDKNPVMGRRFFKSQADPLLDIAQLTADLEFLGHREESEDLVGHYLSFFPEAENARLLKFLRCRELLQGYLERTLPRDSSEKDLLDSQRFLALAFDKALKLEQPSLLILWGDDSEKVLDVAGSLRQVIPADIVYEPPVSPRWQILRLSHLLSGVERSFSRRKSVILVWSDRGYAAKRFLEQVTQVPFQSKLIVRMVEEPEVDDVLNCVPTSYSSGSSSFELASSGLENFRWNVVDAGISRVELARSIVRDMERQNQQPNLAA